MSFDQKLKALRLENKMTQEYVARKLNVARSTIADVYKRQEIGWSYESI